MLLEDFVGELDRPIRSLGILGEELEIMLETNEETKKVLALLYAIQCTIKSIQNLHKKYNDIIDQEYAKIKAAKAALQILNNYIQVSQTRLCQHLYQQTSNNNSKLFPLSFRKTRPKSILCEVLFFRLNNYPKLLRIH